MKNKWNILLSVFMLLMISINLRAQSTENDFAPYGLLHGEIDKNGDTIALATLTPIVIYPKLVITNNSDRAKYSRLVRDVKITLPYAQLVYNTLIETYEYMETLPNDKARQEHLKRMEKDLYKDYRPVLKKLTYSQGKLLIKLIDRECHQSSYKILRAYLGSFRATFWNLFAGMFGASLKVEYDPTGKDAMTERVVVMVEQGSI